ncbi:hypothetical protein RCL_jg13201.t1 [Rhizophagus clarus]|uniref:Uncharacterized protein n=1 Tax=Rhizophagus clarus TaxID=94130 RepID=A0A8H3QCX0_9GLOM|nr:hypothetical protein RCL_jg13201.t1 [Rhizophagus clarus]
MMTTKEKVISDGKETRNKKKDQLSMEEIRIRNMVDTTPRVNPEPSSTLTSTTETPHLKEALVAQDKFATRLKSVNADKDFYGPKLLTQKTSAQPSLPTTPPDSDYGTLLRNYAQKEEERRKKMAAERFDVNLKEVDIDFNWSGGVNKFSN